MNRILRGVNKAKIVPVIKVEAVIGDGTEKDPVRIVIQYWDLKGQLLFVDAERGSGGWKKDQ